MSYGKYNSEKDNKIIDMFGKEVSFKTPEGYSGLFWGTVYNSKGKIMDDASDYFWDLSEEHENDGFEYWETISNFIEEHCSKYIAPYCGQDYHYQCGFGASDMNGLIDFCTKKPIPEMPDMPFEIEGKKYVIKWKYSSGHDDSDSEDGYYSPGDD